jgi:NTP pyrophosphatase (non-canonical NTP hydrolase)
MSKLNLKPNPTLGDLQEYVRQLEEERGFTKDHISAKCMLLAEEVGELLKCVRKTHTTLGIDSNKKYDLDAAGEIADIIIVLTTIANRLGIDIEQAFRSKEEVNKTRVWGA